MAVVNFPSRTRQKSDADQQAQDIQLTLFDVTPERRLFVVALKDIHGRDFVEYFNSLVSATVVDLRKYPHFETMALNHNSAFKAFDTASCVYERRSFSLRPRKTKEDQWAHKAEATEFFSCLWNAIAPREAQIVLIVDASFEADQLKRLLESDRTQEYNWVVKFAFHHRFQKSF